jgi:hypothetical protein
MSRYPPRGHANWEEKRSAYTVFREDSDIAWAKKLDMNYKRVQSLYRFTEICVPVCCGVDGICSFDGRRRGQAE